MAPNKKIIPTVSGLLKQTHDIMKFQILFPLVCQLIHISVEQIYNMEFVYSVQEHMKFKIPFLFFFIFMETLEGKTNNSVYDGKCKNEWIFIWIVAFAIVVHFLFWENIHAIVVVFTHTCVCSLKAIREPAAFIRLPMLRTYVKMCSLFVVRLNEN